LSREREIAILSIDMKRWLNIFRSEKKEINYLYFGLFFLFLSILHTLLPHPSFSSIFYGIGQAFLEVSVLTLIAYSLRKWAVNWLFYLFICATFILALLHFTQFTMVRVMDTT